MGTGGLDPSILLEKVSGLEENPVPAVSVFTCMCRVGELGSKKDSRLGVGDHTLLVSCRGTTRVFVYKRSWRIKISYKGRTVVGWSLRFFRHESRDPSVPVTSVSDTVPHLLNVLWTPVTLFRGKTLYSCVRTGSTQTGDTSYTVPLMSWVSRYTIASHLSDFSHLK